MCKKIIKLIFSISVMVSMFSVNVLAKENDLSIDSIMYEFGSKSSYEITESTASNDLKPLGTLSVAGKVKSSTDTDNSELVVYDGQATISYSSSSKKLTNKDTKWHVSNDKTKKVDNVSLENKIQKGVAIVQTSPDKKNWTTKKTILNFFEDGLNDNIYTASDIEQDNGCYYRVIIAYSLSKKGEKSSFLFVDTTETKTKKYAEVYEFYISNTEKGTSSAETTPRKELGSVVNTGKDNGYDKNNALDKDDPHFGWTLGRFTINGFSDDASTDTENVFLKNVGDKVALWFTLDQNINKLNGDSNLSVSEDENGYDKQFQIKQTNFKHGTLIIQYTDYENKKHEPIVYTDFLKANASTGADTKVQLFEEGDYEVSLDYEIEKKSGIGSIKKDYTNYKIKFSFSIRNSNCMAYPFDLKIGNELSNYAIVSSGFRLDMAKSRYLSINVTRSELKENDGLLTEDERFNRSAKDNEEYTDVGIYKFTVKNKYTGQETEKYIYVGDNKYYKALSKYGITTSEFNEQIKSGCTLKDNGTLTNTKLEEVKE